MQQRKGTIVATQLANYANSDIKYGYITLETDEKEHVRIKIDSYTKYDTLERGESIVAKTKSISSDGVIVAREIRRP